MEIPKRFAIVSALRNSGSSSYDLYADCFMKRTPPSHHFIPDWIERKQLTLFSLSTFRLHSVCSVFRSASAAGGDLAICFTSIQNKSGQVHKKTAPQKEAQSALPMCFPCDAANLVPALCYSSTDRWHAFADAQPEDCIPSRYPIFTDGRTVGFYRFKDSIK